MKPFQVSTCQGGIARSNCLTLRQLGKQGVFRCFPARRAGKWKGREPIFTPTQRRMLEVLADGQPHTKKELHACLVDELGPLSNVEFHISEIRRAIKPFGEDILCVFFKRKKGYQLVGPIRRGGQSHWLACDENRAARKAG